MVINTDDVEVVTYNIRRLEMLTDNDLPVLYGVCYLIGRSHLRIRYSPHDKNDYARDVPHVLLGFIFMPVTIPSTMDSIIKRVKSVLNFRASLVFVTWEGRFVKQVPLDGQPRKGNAVDPICLQLHLLRCL